MKKVIVASLIATTMFTAIAAGAENLKVGHLDLQRLMAQSDAGKEARERYLARAKKYQEEIDTRTERMKSLKKSIEAASAQLKQGEQIPQSVLENDKEYGTQVRELQRLLGGYQDELKVYDAELTRSVLEQLAPILNEYAKQYNYDYIIRGLDALAFANEKLDLTEELIKEFNKKRKK